MPRPRPMPRRLPPPRESWLERLAYGLVGAVVLLGVILLVWWALSDPYFWLVR